MGTGRRVTYWVRQISALGIVNHPPPPLMVCGWPFCKTAGILQVLPSFCRHSVSITSVITTDAPDSCKIPCISALSPRSAARLRRSAPLRLPPARPDGETEPPPLSALTA